MDYENYIRILLSQKNNKIYELRQTKLVKSLINILKIDLKKYNFDNDLNILNEIPKILKKILTENLINMYKNDLFEIYNMINNILYIENITEENYIILTNLKNKLYNSLNFIYNEYENEENICKYKFIKNLILKVKNINEFKNICETYPYLVTISNKQNEPIIYIALNEFIKNIELKHLDNILYYEKIIELIIKESTISKANIENIIIKLNKIDNFYAKDLIKKINKNKNESENYINKKYNIEESFSKEILEEQKQILINYQIKETTCQRKIYTFDGENAKEIDDGISLIYESGIYKLGVHIADPTKYINYNSIIMSEAKKRTTSIYFGDKCIPMYPIELSGGIMSLNEKQNVWAMSYYFDIDSITGELINFEIKNEIIKIEQNLTYDYLDDTLKNGNNDLDFYILMNHLNNLSNLLKRNFNDEIIKTEFNHDTWTTATQIIANAMIFTNMIVAKTFNERELPFIYRNHKIDEENIKNLSKLQENIKNSFDNGNIISSIERIKKLMPRAYYSNKCDGHYALGLENYSHATSPLRRLSDNLVNLCIKKFYLGSYTNEDIKIINEELEKICEQINSKRVSTEMYSKYKEKELIKK